MNDKRRFKSRSPRNPRSPMGMEEEMSGNPAVDGFVLRHREPLKREPFAPRREHVAPSLMDEHDAMIRDIYGDD